MTAALRQWRDRSRGANEERAEQERADTDPQGIGITFLQAIATLESESTSHEAHDTLLARRMGGEVEDIRRQMELLALGGYLYLSRDHEPGYWGRLSPRGRDSL